MKGNKHAPFKWVPFSRKQLKVLTWWMSESLVHDKDGIICDGSVRAGKTIVMSFSYVLWAMENFTFQNFIMAGKTIGAFRRNVLVLLKIILRFRGFKVKDKRADNLLIVRNRGTGTINYFYIFGGRDERSQDLVQGITAAGAFFDEVALMPESFVNQAIARCSVDGAKLWFNCNPEGPYHWFKLEFLDKLDEKNLLHIHFTMDDNPALTEETKARYKRMFAGVFYKRYILGLWVLAEGIIYDMWDEAKHLFEYKRESYDEYGVAIDYATASVMTFGLYGVKRQLAGDKVYLIKEYYYDAEKKGRQKTDAEFADDFVVFLGDINPKAIYIDPSAASLKAELRKRGYHQIKDADNDVINGIRLVATFLSTGRFYVERSCTDTIMEFGSYVWDKKAQEKGEDKPLKQHDHAMDRNRYYIYTKYKKLQVGITAKPPGW
jgi:PBSX family phage terminase large subunit